MEMRPRPGFQPSPTAILHISSSNCIRCLEDFFHLIVGTTRWVAELCEGTNLNSEPPDDEVTPFVEANMQGVAAFVQTIRVVR